MRGRKRVCIVAFMCIGFIFILIFIQFLPNRNRDKRYEYDIPDGNQWEVLSLEDTKIVEDENIDDAEPMSNLQSREGSIPNSEIETINPEESLDETDLENNSVTESKDIETNQSLTIDEINRINEKTMANSKSGVKDLRKINEIQPEELIQLIESYRLPDLPFLNGVSITEEDKQRLYSSRNIEGIPDHVEIQYGIITRNSAVRSFPTMEKISKNSPQEDFDYFQESMFLIGEPILVYHNSTNDEFSFVQGINYFGWVKNDTFGFCTKEEQEKWIEDDSFILFTNETDIDGLRIRMGTKLPLIEEKQSHYIATFPLQQNRQFFSRPVIIGKSNEVSNGFLNYTKENIINLTKRLVNMPYGWGDSGENMDCSSTIGAIYKCFGIILPRNTSTLPYTGGIVTDLSGMLNEEKRMQLVKQPIGSIFIMPGHVVMYMGEIEEIPMIFHNFTKYSKDGSELRWEYHGDITPLDIYGGSGLSYPSLMQTILNFK